MNIVLAANEERLSCLSVVHGDTAESWQHDHNALQCLISKVSKEVVIAFYDTYMNFCL